MRGDETGRDRALSSDETDPRIEQKIDAALRSYQSPGEGPDARLAQARVMERVREFESRQKTWWMWCTAAAACALVIVATMGAAWMMRTPQRAEIAWVPKAPGLAVVESQKIIPGRPQRTSLPRLPAAPHALPRLDVFPTPRPLSEEEQTLVAFAQAAPPAVKKAVVEDQEHFDDPNIVAGMRRPSVESDGKQDH
jgi:hypothetical protein